jgi:hypothetical protein
MQSLSLQAVQKWGNTDGLKHPYSVNVYCPHCGEKCTFTGEQFFPNKNAATVSLRSSCPGCSQRVVFVGLGCDRQDDSMMCDAVVIHPSGTAFDSRLDHLFDCPERIGRRLDSAIQAYPGGDHEGSASHCRAILEGVVKHFLPKLKGTLNQLLVRFSTEYDLTGNIRRLASLIKQCGNLGARFDPDAEVSKDQAEYSLVLTEILLEYLFVLPAHLDALETALGDRPPSAEAPGESRF